MTFWFRRRSCVKQIRQRDPAITATPDQLARAVRQKLLDSDLHRIVPASYCKLTPEAFRSPSAKVGDAGRGAVLTQIESMIDIGYSASSQLEIAEARCEARRTNVDPNDGLAEAKLTAATVVAAADHMADFQAQEDDKVQTTTVYSRRMLRLELSDGSKLANVFAIELQRIPGLDMNTTKMGSKLLLKGALIKDGYLLLTPQTVLVEGGGVREKDGVAEEKLIEKLRVQLGKSPSSSVKASDNSRDTSVGGATGPASDLITARPQRSFSPDEDESELLAALEAEEEMTVASAVPAVDIASNSHTRDATSNVSTSNQAQPKRERAELPMPDGMSQSSWIKCHSQPSNIKTTPRQTATQQDPIMLLDSDDDRLYDSLDDNALNAVDVESKLEPVQRPSQAADAVSNSRYEPIVIESSPEP
uniref:RecQ-mediated genome instability protein 1 n=1 Tax=Melanopsichium pennsylvanicum 4 TaxID=1398559 RepID=A0A077R2G4_9BASI|nr:conserved hypothetical protein [Melanopsichium pennsylvanicum 4]